MSSAAASQPLEERESLQAPRAEGVPVGEHMVLILMSICGTAILLVMQFLEFVGQKDLQQMGTRIRAFPRELLRSVETLTLTVPVAATQR